jgi:glyceraldehyde 3-phosphate dehydrogenase
LDYNVTRLGRAIWYIQRKAALPGRNQHLREEDMGVKIGINGFGRIGRLVARILLSHGDMELVGVNDIAPIKQLAHMFKYDSTYHTYGGTVEIDEDNIVVGGKRIKVTAERDPANIPWAALGADIVLESTGFFTKKEDAGKHLTAGAKRVIISAPAKGDVPTFVRGVNCSKYDPAKHQIISNASCTTNCLGPVLKVLNDSFKIEHGLMTTIHSVTNDQRLLDAPHEDLRRARAAYESMIPTKTGAASAIGLVIPEIEGKMDGLAIRVPTITVSLVDVVCLVEKETTVEAVNAAMKAAADGPMKGFLAYNDQPLVSVDFRGNSHSSIYDAPLTKVTGGKLVKVFSWYDNEWGYACRCVDFFHLMVEKGL